MGKTIRVLMIDDSEDDALLLSRELRIGGYQPEFKRVDSVSAMATALENDKWDIILSDYSMPQFNGLEALKIAKKYAPDIPFILISGVVGEDIAVMAMRKGAQDYLMKDRLKRLVPVVNRELHDAKMRRDQRRAENELKESKKLDQSVLNTVRESLITLDHDLNVVTASRSFYDFFKVKPEETVGRHIFELGNKQWDIPKLRELLETLLSQRITSFYNYKVEHDFATVGRRTMLLNARQIERELGNERIILLAIEDITKREQAEKSLTISEERYRSIIDNSPMGIHIYKLEDDGNLIFTGFNAAADVLTGTDNSKLIGRTIEKAFPSLADSEVPDIYRRIASTGIPWNTEEIYYKDQFINGIFEVHSFQSGPGVVTVIFTDITDRKFFEKERLANEKLQGVLETAGAVCHELNQPLQAISGYSELISMGMDEDDPLYQKANKIKSQVDRIAALTRKFNDITRYTGKLHDSNTKILDLERAQERRKYKRHIPRSGAVVSIESDSLQQFPPINISQGGLALYYKNKENQLGKSGVLTLSAPDEDLFLEEIPYNIISSYSKTGTISSNYHHNTRIGVQFKYLSAKQVIQLRGFY